VTLVPKVGTTSLRADTGGALEPDADELTTTREIARLRGAGDTLASYRAIARQLTHAGRSTRHENSISVFGSPRVSASSNCAL